MAIFKMCYGDEEADIEFSDEELSILKEFVQLARKIEECPVVQMGMPFGFKIAFEEGGSVSVTVSLPEWSLVQLYLYRMRSIILDKDRTNFYKVCRILSSKCHIPEILKAISEERKLYQGENIYNTLRFSSNVGGRDILLTSGQVLHDYLNGMTEYHSFERERKNFERVCGMLPIEFGRALCLWLLQEKGGATLRIAEFVRSIIDVYRGVTTPPIRAELLAFKVGGV
jgi:hypothetical protein